MHNVFKFLNLIVILKLDCSVLLSMGSMELALYKSLIIIIIIILRTGSLYTNQHRLMPSQHPQPECRQKIRKMYQPAIKYFEIITMSETWTVMT